MFELKPVLSFLLACVGNCGFWLFCFNRVNAFGYARPIAKALEKLCIGLCFAIPSTICWLNRDLLESWLQSSFWCPESSTLSFNFWLAWSFLSIVLLGPVWLESRRWLIPPKQLRESSTELHDVHRLIPGGSAQNFSTRCLSLVPLNEFAHLSVTRKTLELPRPIPAADGLTIGHISDLHFTGQYRTEHYQYVLECMMELRADLLIISGDIIDYAKCLPMIKSVLSPLKAPLGVHFVLGNHDRRLKDISLLLDQLQELTPQT
ncbi:MAG: metallophosphoesterase [Pirellulales bacterium]